MAFSSSLCFDEKCIFFWWLAASGWLSVWTGVSSQAVPQVAASIKELCRRFIPGGRAVPFLQKVCAVRACSHGGPMSLFFILACFIALMRKQESVLVVADGKCTLLGDERWSLESLPPASHTAWEFLMLCANALLGYCIKRVDIIFFSFYSAPTVLFEMGTGPAFKIGNISTYCWGRIETVILIWHRHLFLTCREAP